MESPYKHKDAGLGGVRCQYDPGPKGTVRMVLSWDSVTCPDCLKLKQDWEPQSQPIDTRGD